MPESAFRGGDLERVNDRLGRRSDCDTLLSCALSPNASVRARSRLVPTKEPTMSKRARKRRSRKGKAANHGHKPNA